MRNKIAFLQLFLFFIFIELFSPRSSGPARELLRRDNDLKPVEKYKPWSESVRMYNTWIKPIAFFYPDIKIPPPDADLITLRQSLLDAFTVIDKTQITFDELEGIMNNSLSTIMYVIGENKFLVIEDYRNDLYHSEKYATLVDIKYVFSHYKFQDSIRWIN